MPFVLNDRVTETSTSTGTGPMVLLGAIPGYQSFGAGIGVGSSTYYTIVEGDPDIANPQWEVGLGTFNGTSLSRDTLYTSSNNNLPVAFAAGIKYVYVDLPSSRLTGKLTPYIEFTSSQAGSANQQFSDTGLYNYNDNPKNAIVAVNGVIFKPVLNYTISGNVLTVLDYLPSLSSVTVEPSSNGGVLGTAIPYVKFASNETPSAGQMFMNSFIAGYKNAAEAAVVTVNGVIITPTTNYTISGITLTILDWLPSSSIVTIEPTNAAAASGGGGGGNVVYGFLTGATSTINVPLNSGLPIIDGYQTTQSQTILLTNQTTSTENGAWLVTSSGDWMRVTTAQYWILRANNGNLNIGVPFIRTSLDGAADGEVWVPEVKVANNTDNLQNTPNLYGIYLISNTNITGTYNATNKTLTGATALVVDGITLSTFGGYSAYLNIVLLGQTTNTENGVYRITAASASSFTLTSISSPVSVGTVLNNNAAKNSTTYGTTYQVTSSSPLIATVINYNPISLQNVLESGSKTVFGNTEVIVLCASVASAQNSLLNGGSQPSVAIANKLVSVFGNPDDNPSVFGILAAIGGGGGKGRLLLAASGSSGNLVTSSLLPSAAATDLDFYLPDSTPSTNRLMLMGPSLYANTGVMDYLPTGSGNQVLTSGGDASTPKWTNPIRDNNYQTVSATPNVLVVDAPTGNNFYCSNLSGRTTLLFSNLSSVLTRDGQEVDVNVDVSSSGVGNYINAVVGSGLTINNSVLPSAQNWNSVAYGNGRFVAVSSVSATAAAYSTDGASWVASTLPSAQSWASVTYGNNRFVAIATTNSTAAAYSDDGITWEASTLPSTRSWSDVAYGNGRFVAVSSGPTTAAVAAYSYDGINWVASTLPSTQSWRAVTYGNGRFVAVSSGPTTAATAAAYSTDGITWTASTLSAAQAWTSVTYGNNKFVAVATTNSTIAAAYSVDGNNWTLSVLPSIRSWNSVTYGNGRFVAVSSASSTAAAYSTDGASWGASTLPSAQNWNSVAYGNGRFVTVAAASSTAAAYSTDGLTWTSYPPLAIQWDNDISPTSASLENIIDTYSFRIKRLNNGQTWNVTGKVTQGNITYPSLQAFNWDSVATIPVGGVFMGQYAANVTPGANIINTTTSTPPLNVNNTVTATSNRAPAGTYKCLGGNAVTFGLSLWVRLS